MARRGIAPLVPRPRLSWVFAALALGTGLAACASLVGIETVEVAGEGGSAPVSCADAGVTTCSECSSCELIELAPGGAQVVSGSLSGTSSFSPDLGAACPDGAPGPERVVGVKVNAQSGFLTASLKRNLSESTKKPFDSVLYALKDCCAASGVEACGDIRGTSGALNGGEVISFRPTTPAQPVFIVVDSVAGASGDYELELVHSSGVGCVGGRIPIGIEPGSPVVLQGNLDGLGSVGTPCLGAPDTGVGSEVIYEVTAAAAAVKSFTFHVDAAFDVVIQARSSCGAGELRCVNENGAPGGETLTALPNEGSPIYLFVDSQACPAGETCNHDYTLTITPNL